MSSDVGAAVVARQSEGGRVGDVFWVVLRVNELRRAKEARRPQPLAPRAPLAVMLSRPVCPRA